jgi:photosystem II stability/assembly factor-like uncharacterized protein
MMNGIYRALATAAASLVIAAVPLSSLAQEPATFTEIKREVQSVIVHPLQPGRLLALSGGRVITSRDAGMTWRDGNLPQIAWPDRIFAHKGRPGLVYVQEMSYRTTHAFFPDPVRRSGGRTFRSGDFGETWVQATEGFDDDADLALSPFASDPLEPEHLIATGRSFFYCSVGCGLAFGPSDAALLESRDGGATWSSPSTLPGADVTAVTRIEGPTPAAPRRLFFSIREASSGVSRYQVYVSNDGAKTWSRLEGPADWSLQSVTQDPFRGEVIYGFGQKVGGVQEHRRSDDGGATWTTIWGAFTQYPPELLVDPAFKDRLWLFGVAGVHLSDDGGRTWQALGLAADASPGWPHTGFDPQTRVTSVVPDPTDSSRVYAIRNGRLYRGVVPARAPVAVEYRYGDRYWITGSAAEAISQDHRGNEATRTGRSFGLWNAAGAPAGAKAICRFQGDRGHGQESRFIAIEGFECDVVKAGRAFVLEGQGEYFAVSPTAQGDCPAALLPVRRFNNLQSNVNHRYVADAATADEMRAAGWYDEGVRMCARPLGADE